MKLSLYSYCWDAVQYGFDLCGALDNWALYADEIVIAVNTSTDATYEVLETQARAKGYPVKLLRTSFDFAADPFAYGKTVNAALQGCTGDLLIAQDMDERWAGDRAMLERLGAQLGIVGAKAFFIPTIDLYGSADSFVSISRKWYAHLPGLFRGAVNFGLKPDGRPDYNRTSTDELIDRDGNLVATYPLLDEPTIGHLRTYAATGMPFSFHLGYLNLTDRVERAKWWGPFWERATGGDKNGHVTDINELLKRETKPHGLALWRTK